MVWNEFPESIFIEEGDSFALSINITAAPLFLRYRDTLIGPFN